MSPEQEFRTIKLSSSNRLSDELKQQWERLIRAQKKPVSALCYPDYAETLSLVRDDVEIAILRSSGELIALFCYHRIGNGAIDIGAETSDQSVILVHPDAEISRFQFLRNTQLSHWQFTHLETVDSSIQKCIQSWDDGYYVDLSMGLESYLASFSAKGSNVLSDIRRKIRKIERKVGELNFTFHDTTIDAVDDLLEFKNQQLISQYGDNSMQKTWVRSFIKRLQGSDGNANFGILSTLKAGNQTVASHMGMLAGDSERRTFNSWLPAVNPKFRSFSPGLILMWKIILHSAEQDVQRIDLGRGGNQLKRRLANSVKPMAIGRYGGNITWSTISKVEGLLRRMKSRLQSAKNS